MIMDALADFFDIWSCYRVPRPASGYEIPMVVHELWWTRWMNAVMKVDQDFGIPQQVMIR